MDQYTLDNINQWIEENKTIRTERYDHGAFGEVTHIEYTKLIKFLNYLQTIIDGEDLP